ncbi:hypothetical protein ACLOJK_019033 [Asimina triloba]
MSQLLVASCSKHFVGCVDDDAALKMNLDDWYVPCSFLHYLSKQAQDLSVVSLEMLMCPYKIKPKCRQTSMRILVLFGHMWKCAVDMAIGKMCVCRKLGITRLCNFKDVFLVAKAANVETGAPPNRALLEIVIMKSRPVVYPFI